MMFVTVDASAIRRAPAVTTVIEEVRREAEVFVFLSGAPQDGGPAKEKLLGLLQGLAVIAGERKPAVGDGGTKAGLMAAAARCGVPLPARSCSSASLPRPTSRAPMSPGRCARPVSSRFRGTPPANLA